MGANKKETWGNKERATCSLTSWRVVPPGPSPRPALRRLSVSSCSSRRKTRTPGSSPVKCPGTLVLNCFARVQAEQGVAAFWRGNFTNCIRYFPTQAFNFMFKDKIKRMFPKYGKDQFGMRVLTNVASGGLAGAGSLCIVYPLD